MVDNTNISSYMQQPTPFNPLTSLQSFAGTQNALTQNITAQNQAQQSQMDTRLKAAQIRAGQILAKYQDPNGTTRYNDAAMEVAKDPVAALALPDILKQSREANVSVKSRYDPNSGQTVYDSAQKVSAQNDPSNQPPAQGAMGNQSSNDTPGNQPALQTNPVQSGSGGRVLEPSAAQTQQLQDRTAINQKYINDTRVAGDAAPNQIAMLDKIKNLAAQVNTGPQADRINHFKAGLAEIFGVDPSSPAAYEQLNKLLLANGLASGVDNGAGSQAIKQDYIQANPNTGILPSAVIPIADYQQSLYRQTVGRRKGMEKALSSINPNTPNQINPTIEQYRDKYSTAIGNTGPLLYQFHNLKTPEEKQTFLDAHPGLSAQLPNVKKTLTSMGALE